MTNEINVVKHLKRAKRGSATRDDILHLLKTNGAMSASQLSEQLGLTEMGVRRHLYKLIEQQAVEIELVRQSMGRPMQLFHLSAEGKEQFPKHYHQLILDLLQELEALEQVPEDVVHRLFEGRQRSLLSKYESHMVDLSLEERVKELHFIQDSNGYMVQSEQLDDGSWMLHEYNCPIAQVANRYDEPCKCELELFRQLLGTDTVERTECLAQEGQRCSYRITPSS